MSTDRFKNPAVRRMLWRLVIAIGIYIAVIVSMPYILHSHHHHANRVLPFLVPTAPIAIIVITGLYLKEEKDEYWQKSLRLAMVCSIGVTLTFTSIWGALEMYSLVPHFPLFYLLMIFSCLYAVFNTIFQIQDSRKRQ